MLHMGMRAGGGVGDNLVAPNASQDQRYFSQRVVYDLSYYIIINIIWMNIIFGIIIDTFAELRDEKKVRGILTIIL
jgi:inositol 1,4,5-triphosphate receptor type 1